LRTKRLSSIIWLALLPACASPASPTDVPPPGGGSFTSLTIAGADLLAVGEGETFVAKTDTGKVTRPQWASDAPTVATVDAATGQVTAVGIGTATIVADVNGIRATKLIRTLPNFSGSWEGQHQDVDCQSSGDFVRIEPCVSYWDLSIRATIMTLTQHRDQISGTVNIGERVSANVAGSVLSDGTLQFAGALRDFYSNTVELQNVRFQLSPKGQMSGTFEKFYSGTGFSGSLRYFSKLLDITRLSGE